MERKRRIWPRILLIGLGLLVIGLLWVLNRELFNISVFNPEPPVATLLPTFSPSDEEELPATPTIEIMPTTQVIEMPNPDDFEFELVLQGFKRPVSVTTAGDGTNRLFIVEQSGKIWVVSPDYQVLAPVFLDITDRVGDEGNEQGLLGLVFDPAYAQNGYFYVNYTTNNGGTVLARFRVTADPNIADPATELKILELRQPYANHNGGGLAFGPDGYLYASLGDGGLANDPMGNGQRWDTYLGKILRIDVRNEDDWTPVDNPMIDSQYPLNWAIGLRNPWRISFDALTNDLYIADVGQNEFEEINILSAGDPQYSTGGANFGWSYYEGFHVFQDDIPTDFSAIAPIHEYDHSWGCSVTGGYVYRGSELPEFNGVYIYADFCTGIVWGLLQNESGEWQNELLYRTEVNPTGFGQAEDLALYFVDLNGGLYKLVRK